MKQIVVVWSVYIYRLKITVDNGNKLVFSASSDLGLFLGDVEEELVRKCCSLCVMISVATRLVAMFDVACRHVLYYPLAPANETRSVQVQRPHRTTPTHSVKGLEI